MADRADGIGEEEFKPINEDETLGYWINRILLSFILIGFYTVGIKAASFPTYTELFDAFSDKIEGYYSVWYDLYVQKLLNNFVILNYFLKSEYFTLLKNKLISPFHAFHDLFILWI